MARTKLKIEKPADHKTVVDLQGLARRVGKAGAVLVKRGLRFNFPIEVESIAVVLDGPGGARSVVVQSYAGNLGKAAARLESLDTAGTPIKGEVGPYLARLERRGYHRIVAAADADGPSAEKPRRGRKAVKAADAAPATSTRRRGRRKAD